MYRRHVLARYRLIYRRVKWFLIHNLLHVDDPPEKLARGVAVGMFCGIMPVVGFQSALVLFLAWLLKANKLIGLPLVWISNPFTFIPIYLPCYVLGAVLLGHPIVDHEWWLELRNPPAGWWVSVSYYWTRLSEIAAPFWLGSTIGAVILSLLSYFIAFHTIRSYRLRRWGKLIPPVKISPQSNDFPNAA